MGSPDTNSEELGRLIHKTSKTSGQKHAALRSAKTAREASQKTQQTCSPGALLEGSLKSIAVEGGRAKKKRNSTQPHVKKD